MIPTQEDFEKSQAKHLELVRIQIEFSIDIIESYHGDNQHSKLVKNKHKQHILKLIKHLPDDEQSKYYIKVIEKCL